MITMTKETFGQLLKRLIAEAHTSQRQLAKNSGVDLSYINRLANDKAGGIGRDIANSLAPHLRVKPSELIAASAGEDVKIEADIKQKTLEDLSNIKESIAEIEERLRSPHPQTVRLPDYGAIPCGTPWDASQAPVEYMDIPLEFTNGINPKRLLILHASGDSMIEEDIYDRDVVLVDKEAEFIDGKTYAVRIPGDGYTIKKAYRTPDNRIRLVPANRNYSEKVVSDSDIIGRVIISFKLKRH